MLESDGRDTLVDVSSETSPKNDLKIAGEDFV